MDVTIHYRIVNKKTEEPLHVVEDDEGRTAFTVRKCTGSGFYMSSTYEDAELTRNRDLHCLDKMDYKIMKVTCSIEYECVNDNL